MATTMMTTSTVAKTTGRAPAPSSSRRTATARRSVVRSAAISPEEVSLKVKATATEVYKTASGAWDELEDKPTFMAASAAALFALYISNGVVSFVDSIPIFNSLMELIGIGCTAYFVKTYLLLKEDREMLVEKVTETVEGIKGKASDII